MIPDWAKYELDAYVERGKPVGSFLQSVLSNDLIRAFDTREPYPLRCDNCDCELFDNNCVETPQNFYCDEHCQEEDFEKRLSLAERSINPKIWAKI